MPRLIVMNNYSFERVWGEVIRGEKPAHHLYGIDVLQRAGWKIDVVPVGGSAKWIRCLERILAVLRWPVPLGDLAQQWQAWTGVTRADVIYAPCQTQTKIFAYLRALGLLGTPLVAIAHHPPVTGRLTRLRRWCFSWETRGTDRYAALSEGVATVVRELRKSGRKVEMSMNYSPVLRWGPDLSYYDRFVVTGPGEGSVATGRTGRDWLTFGRGATRAGTPAQIMCLNCDVRPEFAGFGANIRVTASMNEQDRPYPQLLPVLARARVIAIPLVVGQATSGLTSLADALGLGKPVIMTRQSLLDIDLESEGIGRWVEAGDAAGWANALQWFEMHPDEAVAMGQRARAYAEKAYNSDIFAEQIMGILESVI